MKQTKLTCGCTDEAEPSVACRTWNCMRAQDLLGQYRSRHQSDFEAAVEVDRDGIRTYSHRRRRNRRRLCGRSRQCALNERAPSCKSRLFTLDRVERIGTLLNPAQQEPVWAGELADSAAEAAHRAGRYEAEARALSPGESLQPWFRPGRIPPMRFRTEPQRQPPSDTPQPDPDQAWKVLALNIDWIKHAENKAAATLTASGIIGGVLYNLVKGQSDAGDLLSAAAGLCAFFAFAGGLCAAIALRPRHLRMKEEPTSLLYYSHIARTYRRDDTAGYVKSLRETISNPDHLVDEVGAQIHANAHVAAAKFKWGNLGLTSVLLGLLTLAAITLLLAQEISMA